MQPISPERSSADPDTEDKKLDSNAQAGVLESGDVRNADGSSMTSGSDVLALQDVDPVLNMKMHLVNNVSRDKRGSSAP